jgi:DNA-binding CsgD family transcriptional regulator/plasmid stabilization system protein ParE
MPEKATRTEANWLSHLELLAELPYPGRVLMPVVLTAVREAFDDSPLGFFVWVDSAKLEPVAIWCERNNGAITDLMRTRLPEVFENFPLKPQLDTDGELIRIMQAQPDDAENWIYKEGFHPLGVHWGISAPLLDQARSCHGFIYIYRTLGREPWSDEDNLRLKRARDRLVSLGQRTTNLPPCSYRFRHAAQFHFDLNEKMIARSAHGVELLYQYQDFGENFVPWNTDSIAALPAHARAIVTSMCAALALGEEVKPVSNAIDLPAGRFEFCAEPLTAVDGGETTVAVRISQHEPLDIAVARALFNAPFSLQEKRILVASTRKPSLQQLADHLGVTVGTLKIYINKLQAKAGLSSRQAVIDSLLSAKPGEFDA